MYNCPMSTTMKWSLAALAIILVALGARSIVLKYATSNGGSSGQVACTMEALLCPDGSGVGRQGRACVFAACPSPATGYYTGTLRQSSGQFQLILPAPVGAGQEVSYVMPLDIAVSNGLAQLVGKNVRAYGDFREGNVLQVDHLEAAENSDPSLGTAGVGQSAYVNGVRITLDRITADSRCPADVQCIQAGSVTAVVHLQSDTDSATTTIVSGAAPVGFDSFHVSIARVEPQRTSTHVPDPKSYLVTFRVVPNAVPVL